MCVCGIGVSTTNGAQVLKRHFLGGDGRNKEKTGRVRRGTRDPQHQAEEQKQEEDQDRPLCSPANNRGRKFLFLLLTSAWMYLCLTLLQPSTLPLSLVPFLPSSPIHEPESSSSSSSVSVFFLFNTHNNTCLVVKT